MNKRLMRKKYKKQQEHVAQNQNYTQQSTRKCCKHISDERPALNCDVSLRVCPCRVQTSCCASRTSQANCRLCPLVAVAWNVSSSLSTFTIGTSAYALYAKWHASP